MRTFRVALLVAGLIALAAGIALVVTPRPAAPRLLEAPPNHDVYLGTETCFVCHPSVRRSHDPALTGTGHASSAVRAALVSSPDAPHTAGTSASRIDGAPNESATLAAALPDPDSTAEPASRYVLQTERGYAVLPDQWGMSGADGAWLGDCASCHLVDRRSGQRLLSGRDFTCEMCHGPGGVHVEALVSPRVSEQLRRSSAPLVDLALCQSCHAWAQDLSGSR